MRLPSSFRSRSSYPSLSARSGARFVALVLFVALFVVLLAPGCGRSSLELETPAEGGVVPSTCGPSNCPNGCCDGNGICRTGADTRACGSTGQRCSDCIANGFQFCDGRKVCGRSVTTCGAAECPGGCCSFDGATPKCLAGTDPNACGRSGASCVDCGAQGRSCDPVQRDCSVGKCDASNCSGCCVGDKCLDGTDGQACGSNGQACESCTIMGQSCRNNPGGGGRCEGTPTCGPQNCGGCCNGTVCVAGSDSSACGKQGMACSNCLATGKQCVAQGQPNERTCQTPVTCNAATCPGCCVGNNCVVATTPAACGKGGQACVGCGANETCNAGVCTPQANCGPANCAGCCIGADVCAVGSQNTACGLAGAQCLNCTGQGKVCQGGSCQTPVCGPGNCAGCCSGNTCVIGTQDNACGQAGAACNDCTPGNQVCQGRVCQAKCGPGNCAGCCTPANACALGFTNGSCGSGGAACSNCTAVGSTCDTLVNPRVCTNAQNQCPAGYANCPAGVTTPVTPSLQGLCDDVTELDPIQAACSAPAPGGPDTVACIAAFQQLAVSNPACAACLAPFDVPFTQLTGIYRCAAPFVSAACNRSTGCATDCQDTSCTQCPPASEDQCRNQVNGGGGQCNPFVQQTACVAPALGAGALCRPSTYPGSNFGRWLRAVGDHFCGNGP
jgi:hypothetical protein